MHSLRTRFIVFFGLFILLSSLIMGIFSGLTILNTGISLSAKFGEPGALKSLEIIDGDEFERFCRNPSEDDPYYEKTRLKLLELKNTVGCKYLYTMVPVEGTIFKYIIDGSCDPSDEENFSPLNTEEDIESYGSAPLDAMAEGKICSSGIEKMDEWGWTISTYGGIMNSRGEPIGFVGIDFDVQDIILLLIKRIISIAVVSLIILILGVILISIFTSNIFGRIKKISQAMEQIASGKADLTFRVPEHGNNELAQLAKHCNGVIGSLNSLIAQLQGESGVLNETGTALSSKMENHINVLNSAASQITDISKNISEQTTRVEAITNGMQSVDTEIENLNNKLTMQSQAIEQSSAIIEEITANIKSVDRNVNEILEEYQALVLEAEEGQSQQTAVSSQIANIEQQSESLMTANAAIASIAKQTNLLAMNAAIEASHAGEAGKGFAVVAAEIRKLAETSAKQSESISHLLQGIAASIEGIVTSSKMSSANFSSVSAKIRHLQQLITEVQQGMNEERLGAENILNSMITLEGTTKDITAASSHMKGESNSVFEGIRVLNELAEKTHSQSDTVTSHMQEMKESAQEAVSASDRNLQASGKVSDMINGFSV